MSHGSIEVLRDLLDVFSDRLAAGETITYSDAAGSWTLRDAAAPPTPRRDDSRLGDLTRKEPQPHD